MPATHTDPAGVSILTAVSSTTRMPFCSSACTHLSVIQPRIVVTQNRDDACGGAETLQCRRDLLRSDESPADHALDDKVAENADHIGARSVGAVDYFAELLDPIERRPDMKVCQDSDT